MYSNSAPLKHDIQGSLELPLDILIKKYPYIDELTAARMDAPNDACKSISDKVSKGILETSKEDRQCSEKAWESASTKAVASEKDLLNNALADLLATKLADEPLDVTNLRDLSRCHHVIPRLTTLHLCPLDKEHVPWIKKIHSMNSSIKWNLDTASHNLSLLNDSEVLEGLRGKLTIRLDNQECLCTLENICETCHPDLGLELMIDAAADVRIQHLQKYDSILKRLLRLTADLSITNIPTQHELSFLDRICGNHTFKLALNIEKDFRLLRTTTHVPGSCERTRTQWVLKKEGVAEYLETEKDVSLFKEICKTHPDVKYDVTLKNAGLLRVLLQGFAVRMRVSFLRNGFVTCSAPHTQGLEIKCGLSCLNSLLGLDLSSLTVLELVLDGNFKTENPPITTVAKGCPNLKFLKIDANSRIGDLCEFARLLQAAFNESWKDYRMVSMASNPEVIILERNNPRMFTPNVNSYPTGRSRLRDRILSTGVRSMGGLYLFIKLILRK